MNEAQLLMYLLSRKKNESVIGATKDEMCSKLGLTGRNGDYKFWNLLREFNQSLFTMGLTIKHNPVNNHWFVGFQEKMDSRFAGTMPTLTPRLAATLFTILLLYLGKTSKITSAKVTELREKQDISRDLGDLEQLGYITSDKDVIVLTPKVFYFIDVNELIERIKQFKYSSI